MSRRGPWAVVWPAAWLLLLLWLPAAGCGRGTSGTAGANGALTVGVHGIKQGVVIPGPECEPLPLTDRDQPVVVRITRTYPHGSDFRYDLEYYGLEPGTHDLMRYLRRKDGTAITGAAPVEVTIADSPPPTADQRLTALDDAPPPRVGGYTLMLWLGGIAWALGLLAFLFLYKPRKAAAVAEERPLTLADRLRPLVEQGRAGALDAPGKAELERLVLGYWGGKLGLDSIGSVGALQQLKEHAEAGALVRRLETWLHAPPGRADDVDVEALLAPYANIPADAVPAGRATASGASA